MSYNIDTWHTKKLNNLRIKLKDLHRLGNIQIIPTETEENWIEWQGETEIETISGVQDEKEIVVENIELAGEGSGRRFEEFCDLLRGSSGELDAVLTWEHGDSVTKLEVRDGEVRHGEADLKTVAFRP